jgi:hypothetical protein
MEEEERLQKEQQDILRQEQARIQYLREEEF